MFLHLPTTHLRPTTFFAPYSRTCLVFPYRPSLVRQLLGSISSRSLVFCCFLNSLSDSCRSHARSVPSALNSMDMHADGIHVATGQIGSRAEIRVWRADTLETVSILHGAHTRGVASVAFGGPDGNVRCKAFWVEMLWDMGSRIPGAASWQHAPLTAGRTRHAMDISSVWSLGASPLTFSVSISLPSMVCGLFADACQHWARGQPLHCSLGLAAGQAAGADLRPQGAREWDNTNDRLCNWHPLRHPHPSHPLVPSTS